ncbi:gluconate transporter family protein, partial [Pseudomonas syringae pv. actinidiae ICMP 18804]
WLSGRMHIEEPAELGELFSAKPDPRRQPGFGISLLIILLPISRRTTGGFGYRGAGCNGLPGLGQWAFPRPCRRYVAQKSRAYCCAVVDHR